MGALLAVPCAGVGVTVGALVAYGLALAGLDFGFEGAAYHLVLYAFMVGGGLVYGIGGPALVARAVWGRSGDRLYAGLGAVGALALAVGIWLVYGGGGETLFR